MKILETLMFLAIVQASAMNLHADVLELKNGRILNGTYMGGTAGTIRFETGAGVEVIETRQALALTFTGAAAPAAPAPTPATTPPAPAEKPAAAPPAAQAGPRKVTLASGTMLLVRMKDSVSSRNRAGTPFTTRLEYDLFAEGAKVLPAGTLIYGEVKSSSQARRAFGQSTLDIRLTRISLPTGIVSIVSSPYQEAGEKAVKDAARGAAAGAAIGAIVDGGSGAGEGAAIGAVVGALRRGESVVIPPNALLQFNLVEATAITVGG